jgi:dihydrofolate reductase
MRIVIVEFMSLDGVVQAPGGPDEDTDGGFAHGGWSMQFFDPETMGAALGELMERTEALLFGRRTWQVMAAAWPDRAGDPFADRMNEIDKYVVSSTLSGDDLTWNNTTLIAPDDLVAEVERLRKEDGGAVQVMGSASLARTLISKDLVDEYVMSYVEGVMKPDSPPQSSAGSSSTYTICSRSTSRIASSSASPPVTRSAL